MSLRNAKMRYKQLDSVNTTFLFPIYFRVKLKFCYARLIDPERKNYICGLFLVKLII